MPAIVVELQTSIDYAAWPTIARELQMLAKAHPHTARIAYFLRHESLPVDVRHNSKINREALAAWAEEASYSIERR